MNVPKDIKLVRKSKRIVDNTVVKLKRIFVQDSSDFMILITKLNLFCKMWRLSVYYNETLCEWKMLARNPDNFNQNITVKHNYR